MYGYFNLVLFLPMSLSVVYRSVYNCFVYSYPLQFLLGTINCRLVSLWCSVILYTKSKMLSWKSHCQKASKSTSIIKGKQTQYKNYHRIQMSRLSCTAENTSIYPLMHASTSFDHCPKTEWCKLCQPPPFNVIYFLITVQTTSKLSEMSSDWLYRDYYPLSSPGAQSSICRSRIRAHLGSSRNSNWMKLDWLLQLPVRSLGYTWEFGESEFSPMEGSRWSRNFLFTWT